MARSCRLLWIASVLSGCTREGRDTTPVSDTDGSNHTATDTGTLLPAEPLLPSDVATDHAFGALRVEIDHTEGDAPDPEVLDLLTAELERLRLGGQIVKPLGIDVVIDEILPDTGVQVHTFEALSSLLLAHAGAPRDGESAVLHALYVDGSYEDDTEVSSVLGFAWGGSYLVMFPDNIAASCAQNLASVRPGDRDRACEVAEAAVLMHELGHLFGLVNLGAPMTAPHEDLEHPHHDADDGCLMYWLMNGSGAVGTVGQRFGRGEIEVPRYDSACDADLLALQASALR